MALEKLVPYSGLVKSLKELKKISDDSDRHYLSDGFEYEAKRLEVIGVSLLNAVYVAGAVIGAAVGIYYLFNG